MSTSSRRTKLDAEQLRTIIESTLDDDKAEAIVSIPLRGKSDMADFMIIASGRSQRHVSSLADKLAKKLKEVGFEGVYLEGKETGDWVLVDAGDIIVHLFHPEVRMHYNLEKMWAVDVGQQSPAAAMPA